MAINYYEHHLGDYAKDAGYLPMIKEGAYRRLIDAYYNREGPLPSDLKECYELARCISKPERDAVKSVLERFFELRTDGYHQKRCDEEIAKFKAKSEAARASANARWSHSERNANASKPHMRNGSESHALQSPVPNLQSPVTKLQSPDSGSGGDKNRFSEKPVESEAERNESAAALQRIRERIGRHA